MEIRDVMEAGINKCSITLKITEFQLNQTMGIVGIQNTSHHISVIKKNVVLSPQHTKTQDSRVFHPITK